MTHTITDIEGLFVRVQALEELAKAMLTGGVPPQPTPPPELAVPLPTVGDEPQAPVDAVCIFSEYLEGAGTPARPHVEVEGKKVTVRIGNDTDGVYFHVATPEFAVRLAEIIANYGDACVEDYADERRYDHMGEDT